jgi:uncharacterized protein YwqG
MATELTRRGLIRAALLAAGLILDVKANAESAKSDHMFARQEDIFSALLSASLEEGSLTESEAKLLAAQARPGLWLQTNRLANESDIPLGATKIGGRPDLPTNISWPIRPAYTNANGRALQYQNDHDRLKSSPPNWISADQLPNALEDYRKRIKAVSGVYPLGFIAQIDLVDASAAGALDPDMPNSGRLWLFYDTIEAPWGFDPSDKAGAHLIFEPDHGAMLSRREHPAAIEDFRDSSIFPPVSCVFHSSLMPLPPESAAYEALDLPQSARDGYESWWSGDAFTLAAANGLDWSSHRISGWPTPIQNDMQAECAIVAAGYSAGTTESWQAARAAGADRSAKDWVFLMQIDSDDKANMQWGDSGQLYVWIHREDLRARRFENARLILQSY